MHDFQQKEQSKSIIKGIDCKPFIEPELDARYYLQLPPDKLIITMIGSLERDRGHCFFLELAKSVEKKYDNTHFLIVHEEIDTDFQAEFKDMIAQSKLGNKLDIIKSTGQIPDILKSTDIFVEPTSSGKNFPYNILKAMATGLPVVSVSTALLQSVVLHDETGFLIEKDDLDKGIEKLSLLIENSEMSKKMGKLGQERVIEHFSK